MKGTNEEVLSQCMKFILEHVQNSRENIVNDLLRDIQAMQQDEEVIDVGKLQSEIDKLMNKKRNAIDLMLEGLISKEDLKDQTAFYESKITALTEEVNNSRNINSVHEKQIDKIKTYIEDVNKTAEINADNTDLYGKLLERIVVHENCVIDFYLKCIPFGFRLNYHTRCYKRIGQYDIIVDSFDVVH